jgi:hypothetical protein
MVIRDVATGRRINGAEMFEVMFKAGPQLAPKL